MSPGAILSLHEQSGTNAERLAATPNPPVQLWRETDTGLFYLYDAGWHQVGVPGPSGPQGPAGPPGPTNPAAVTGPGSATPGDLALFASPTGTVLGDAGIPAAQVARTDQANTFTQGQTLQLATPVLQFSDTSGAANQRVANIYANGGYLVFNTAADGGAVQGQSYLDRSGNVFTNGAIYERTRSVAMGTWIDVPFNAANYANISVAAGNVTTHAYTLIGSTLLLTVELSNVTVPSAGQQLSVFWNGGSLPSTRPSVGTLLYYEAGYGWDTGIANCPSGAAYVVLQPRSLGTFNAGTHYFYLSLAVSIG